MKRLAALSVASLLAAGAPAAHADSPTKLLRFPDIQGERIAFVYAGDIYVVNAGGGTALRLTSHPGAELYPKFSPDGSQIAFSAEYNGTRQVFVMPSTGGEPRQLTWYGDVGAMPPRGGTDNRVLDWTPDGKNIVVRMNRLPYDERAGRPYLVPVAGGNETPMPMPESGGGMLSPDGSKFVYTPIDRDFRSWKRYRGGRAQDVWIYDLAANTSLQLTNDRATDHQPMWIGDTIYFVSDRNDSTLNLYSMPPQGGPATKLTQFADFDILWPSAGSDALVFEKGGAIWRFDPATSQAAEVPIRVAGDTPGTQPRFVKAADFVESFDLSPAGERAVFAARGDIFTAPAKNGEPRNITMTPDAREHSVSWSPDGRTVAYLSDATGEYELYVRPQDGKGAARRVTTDGDIWRFAPVWSPDSSKLAYGDKKQRLRIVDVATGATTDADTSTKEDITDYRFSPDSRWLAYVKSNASGNSSIWLYSLDTREARQLTPDDTSERNPVFDPKGRYLYFLSNRDYNLAFSAYEFNFLYRDATRIYAATLAADGPALYSPQSDEVQPAADAGESKDDEKKPATKPQPLRVDIPGFNQRVVALNAPSGNYAGLAANADGVFFVAIGDGAAGNELRFLALEPDSKPEAVAKVGGYTLSADGSKLLLSQGSNYAIVDAKPGAEFDKHKLALERMELRIEPRREWQQMYVDAWRILRDWFYDPGMHGQDWPAIRAKYEPLVAHVATRGDLDYLFQEIAGELNSGHVYVQGGDQPAVERRPGGKLGAELVTDASGYARIAKIFASENWEPRTRSPLTAQGVNVKEGDLILAIDNVSTRGVDNVYRLLEGKADRTVSLRVNATAQETGAREVLVRTIADERELRYLDWVQERRRMVDRLSDGRIGYIHVPNTAVEGSREMFRGMNAYNAKDALIIDDRYNGGGFIPDRLIELLARQPLNYWKQRGLDPNATPLLHHRGPKAMLINGLSSSGGDALPYYFRKLGLGKIIGTRTWGGLIGISGNPSLADNGSILAATFSFMDTDGRWAVENQGVAPDIEVIDRPELIHAGRDPSIERAVQELLAELEANPPPPVVAPPAPTQFPPPTR
ncbi:S41 family peptidase [Chiayiivirga flava]|uniref:Tricorn protease homolog n=1 Tax=Chiayiivirga flava TaxID=659595 RepID=A0A7W8D7U4_9GAMM|nr:S41 family peptidase [Chiayiivirga flava]MBB5207858.1 tricorn protease [Chiayiivirga flava]